MERLSGKNLPQRYTQRTFCCCFNISLYYGTFFIAIWTFVYGLYGLNYLSYSIAFIGILVWSLCLWVACGLGIYALWTGRQTRNSTSDKYLRFFAVVMALNPVMQIVCIVYLVVVYFVVIGVPRLDFQ